MTAISPFASLCAVGFFARLSYALARSPVLALFALYLGAGPEAIGLAVGISTVTGIFFKLPAGALSDIIGRRRMMMIGLVFFAAVPFAYLFIRDYQALVAVRFLHGFATAIYGPVAMAVVMDTAGTKKGEMLSWFSSITIIGNLLGAPIGGFILHASGGGTPDLQAFQTVYLISGIGGLLSLLLAWRLLRQPEQREPHRSLRDAYRRLFSGIREVASDKRVMITANMEGLQNLSVGALEAFLPIYAVTQAGLNVFQAGLLWGVQVLVTILAKPVMGRISDRFGRKPLISTGMVLCAFAFAAIPLLHSFFPLLAAAAVFGLGEAFVTSSSAALVADLCRERHFGTAMGTFGTIYDIGHASGPIVAGLLLAHLDFLPAFAIIATLMLLSVPFFTVMVRVK